MVINLHHLAGLLIYLVLMGVAYVAIMSLRDPRWVYPWFFFAVVILFNMLF